MADVSTAHRPQVSNPGQCLTMVKTSFNLNATAGVTGRSEKAFLSHVVIGQNHPFNGSPHSTRLSIYVQSGHETRRISEIWRSIGYCRIVSNGC